MKQDPPITPRAQVFVSVVDGPSPLMRSGRFCNLSPNGVCPHFNPSAGWLSARSPSALQIPPSGIAPFARRNSRRAISVRWPRGRMSSLSLALRTWNYLCGFLAIPLMCTGDVKGRSRHQTSHSHDSPIRKVRPSRISFLCVSGS